MKSITAIAILSLIAFAQAATITSDGEPPCDTEQQVSTTFFRNYFDPTAYWVCVALNVEAIPQRCPDGSAFLDSLKSCVQWDDWFWEVPT